MRFPDAYLLLADFSDRLDLRNVRMMLTDVLLEGFKRSEFAPLILS